SGDGDGGSGDGDGGSGDGDGGSGDGDGGTQTPSTHSAANPYGMARIHLPDGTVTYTVTIIARYYKNNTQVTAPNVYGMNIHLPNGNVVSSLNYGIDTDPANNMLNAIHYITINNLSGDQAYFIPNILTYVDDITADSIYDTVTYELSAFSFNNPTAVEFKAGIQEVLGQYDTPLVAGGTLSNLGGKDYTNFVATVTEDLPQQTTDDTFKSIGGEYNLLYLLNHYNVVSFGNVESSHIIGPIIALGEAKRNANEISSNVLVFSERSKGVSSYVGIFNAASYNASLPGANARYFYDFEEKTFTSGSDIPMLYIPQTGYSVVQNGTTSILEYVSNGTNLFLSPNYDGEVGAVLQNDNFISSSDLKTGVDQGISTLQSNGSIAGSVLGHRTVDVSNVAAKTTVTTLDDHGNITGTATIDNALTIEHGYHYTVSSGTKPENIILDFGNQFFYGSSSDSTPTSITLKGGSLITGSGFILFPNIYIKDALHTNPYLLPTPDQGKDGEYSDLGNKVIWDLSVFTNNIAFAGSGINVVGHMVAPNTNIYAYESSKNASNVWTVSQAFCGGNVNGALIAQNVYSGSMEIHLWPYMDSKEREEHYNNTSLTLAGTKTTNTGYFVDGFQFVLQASSGDTDGYTMPSDSTASSGSDGSFEFGSIAFKKDGTYVFTVTETQSSINYPYLGFVFDTRTYTVTVVVGKTVENTDTDTTTTYTIDSVTVSVNSGTSPTPPTTDTDGNYDTSASIIFLNTYEVTELPDTGGSGTSTYILCGLSMMAVAIILRKRIYFKKVRR
ncbi:MAG: LPXTG cell wall anchor domain-containing protein, partial [Eubacteriales bacterium]